MPDFETYVARHGEPGAQAIIEQIERYEGIRSTTLVPLEDRWNALMGRAHNNAAPAMRLAA